MRKIDFHLHTVASPLDAEFEFCQSKLDEYINGAGLECIAITNHNLFDKAQFITISDHIDIPVYPGIEVNLERGQILVISDGEDLDEFDAACRQVTTKCNEFGGSIGVEDFKHIFGDLGKLILIPHYEKKPPIDDQTLACLSPFVTAGEVSSPKKFMYCMKGDDRLVPVYFSDCRIRQDLNALPIRQTFLDCSELNFKAIKECLRDKSKVALSRDDGNSLFRSLRMGSRFRPD